MRNGIHQYKYKRAGLLAGMLALLFSGIALAALDPVNYVLELQVKSVRLPGHTADKVLWRSCENCKPRQAKVNAATQYRVGGFNAPTQSLNTFRQIVRKALRRPGSDDALIMYVVYAADTRLVTEVVLSGPGADALLVQQAVPVQ